MGKLSEGRILECLRAQKQLRANQSRPRGPKAEGRAHVVSPALCWGQGCFCHLHFTKEETGSEKGGPLLSTASQNVGICSPSLVPRSSLHFNNQLRLEQRRAVDQGPAQTTVTIPLHTMASPPHQFHRDLSLLGPQFLKILLYKL